MRGRFESSILLGLMANLPLAAPFTQHLRLSLERAHCRLSSHPQTSECNTVPVSPPTCMFVPSVRHSRQVCCREVRSGCWVGFCFKNFLFAFDLDLRSVGCCLCYFQGFLLSVSGELRGACPFKSYCNNRLMG